MFEFVYMYVFCLFTISCLSCLAWNFNLFFTVSSIGNHFKDYNDPYIHVHLKCACSHVYTYMALSQIFENVLVGMEEILAILIIITNISLMTKSNVA